MTVALENRDTLFAEKRSQAEENIRCFKRFAEEFADMQTQPAAKLS
ncbi:MAG: hypothetical protein H0Z35_02910 [Thermoanaerobacteraceae bacterium]|nr:hypothetical protein [Thermoanaerobacteraceae bacterium]